MSKWKHNGYLALVWLLYGIEMLKTLMTSLGTLSKLQKAMGWQLSHAGERHQKLPQSIYTYFQIYLAKCNELLTFIGSETMKKKSNFQWCIRNEGTPAVWGKYLYLKIISTVTTIYSSYIINPFLFNFMAQTDKHHLWSTLYLLLYIDSTLVIHTLRMRNMPLKNKIS